MGLCFSEPRRETLCGVAFTYTATPIHSQFDEEHTYKYRDVTITEALHFGRFSIALDYLVALHFIDRNCLLLCREGAAILVTQSATGRGLQATVTWMMRDEYDWVLPRLERMTEDTVLTSVISAARALTPLQTLRHEMAEFEKRSLLTTTQAQSKGHVAASRV